MARVTGIIPLIGTLGNLTFLRTQHGDIVRRKSSLTKERVKTAPEFARTRENYSEFANAGFAASNLRGTFITAITDCYDNKQRSRLMSVTTKVIQTDMISERGRRNFISANVALFKGFSWNVNVGIKGILKAWFTVAVDRVAGTVTVSIPSFVPINELAGNPEATHYKIITSAAEIDWMVKDNPVKILSTGYLPYDENASADINNVLSLTAGTTLPVFTTIAIRWYQEVSGEYYALKNLKYDTAGIVGVD